MNRAELVKAIAELIVDKIEIGEEPTNGEVMQTLFPKCTVRIDSDGWFITTIDGYTEFTSDWWNAPYQKGGDSEE